MQAGTTAFTSGARTPTWGFNGSYLGPTLRAKRGEKVELRVRNTLDEASPVHWHGMHLPAKMDGGPHQMVQPGANAGGRGRWASRSCRVRRTRCADGTSI
ncbi:multicopper oxidase domain-containing protein [Streptomyces sp. NPDC051322]|uniref:multicopper oxidase domain-containing protein n=1 Tax=Streptomyces sp. NPDC051322 TaxID=3154645 RepID=UPI003450A309